MPELRKDPITGTWVILSAERKKRPKYYQIVVDKDISLPENCPFCERNEQMTPPEIYAVRRPDSRPNQPGWEIRVIPNKFPALRIEGDLNRSGEGFYDKMNGIGAHEVIVETPDHRRTITDFRPAEIQHLLHAVKNRILDLRNDIRFKYIMVFKNSGATAGATMSHSHTQLIALPVVPVRVQTEIDGARTHFQMKERCVFCDIIQYEKETNKRLLFENAHFTVLAPYAPRFPFELGIYPKRHDPSFEGATDAELAGLGEILQETLSRIRKVLDNPDYNLIVHNAPFSNNVKDFFHWHIEFMPILSRMAGFEWGTGFHINPIFPEESIQVLRSI